MGRPGAFPARGAGGEFFCRRGDLGARFANFQKGNRRPQTFGGWYETERAIIGHGEKKGPAAGKKRTNRVGRPPKKGGFSRGHGPNKDPARGKLGPRKIPAFAGPSGKPRGPEGAGWGGGKARLQGGGKKVYGPAVRRKCGKKSPCHRERAMGLAETKKSQKRSSWPNFSFFFFGGWPWGSPGPGAKRGGAFRPGPLVLVVVGGARAGNLGGGGGFFLAVGFRGGGRRGGLFPTSLTPPVNGPWRIGGTRGGKGIDPGGGAFGGPVDTGRGFCFRSGKEKAKERTSPLLCWASWGKVGQTFGGRHLGTFLSPRGAFTPGLYWSKGGRKDQRGARP